MTTFPGSPRLLKGGSVLIDPDTSAVQRIIALQYNPDTLSRTLEAEDLGNRSVADCNSSAQYRLRQRERQLPCFRPRG